MTKVCCVSDLHENWVDTPECDILIVAGDLTYTFKHDLASQQKVIIGDFRDWAVEQPAKHIVVIAGNHDQSIQRWGWPGPDWHRYRPRIWYLQDNSVILEGLKIWGTPWQPWFYDWAFNAPKRNGEAFLREKFSQITNDVDIIVCHGPPYGLGDHELEGMYEHYGYGDTPARSGSRALGAAMRRVEPQLLVCGHIHEGYGVYDVNRKRTKVANAAIVNYRYQVVNDPIVFDL